MKHNIKISIILLTLFLITQLIGLAVVNFYLDKENKIPYGFDQKEQMEKTPNFYSQFLTSLITSFIIVILLVLFLIKIKSSWFMRIWFFIVIVFAMGITISALLIKLNIIKATTIALLLSLFLAYLKVFKKNPLTHNLTELLVYPGIAAIFATMLNLPITILLLFLISIYDIWAVWHSKLMLKMAKYQMNEVGIFGGLFIPYASKKIKEKIKLLKLKYKNNIPENIIKKSKIKIRMAILGGGDIVYPIIAAGVAMKTFNAIYAPLLVIFFSCLALLYIFIFGKKEKPYPAMPYLTTGIYLGLLISWLISLI